MIEINADTVQRNVYSRGFSITPDTDYLVSAAAWVVTTDGATGTCEVYFQTAPVVNGVADWNALTETLIHSRTDASYNATGAHGQVAIKTGATAQRARFRIRRVAGGTARARAGGFSVEKRNGADLIINGAVSKRFFMDWTNQNTFTSTTAEAIGVGVTATVDFAPRASGTNPVMATFNCRMNSTGSGTALIKLQRWNGTAWVNHDAEFGIIPYEPGLRFVIFRRVEGFGAPEMTDGTYRLATNKQSSANADYSLGQMTVTFEQLNK